MLYQCMCIQQIPDPTKVKSFSKFFLYLTPVKFVFDISPVAKAPVDEEFKNLFCS